MNEYVSNEDRRAERDRVEDRVATVEPALRRLGRGAKCPWCFKGEEYHSDEQLALCLERARARARATSTRIVCGEVLPA